MHKILFPQKLIAPRISKFSHSAPPTNQLIPNFARAKFEDIKKELNERSWIDELNHMNVEDSWTYLKNLIQELTIRHVPHIKRRNSDRPMWMTTDVRSSGCEEQK